MVAAGGFFAVSGMVMAENDTTETGSLNRVVLKVENLSCGGCFSGISEAIKPLEGYSGMGTNLWRNRVGVDFSSPLTPEVIAGTISDLGYPAMIQSVEPILPEESFARLENLKGARSCCGAGFGVCGAAAASERRRVSCCIN